MSIFIEESIHLPTGHRSPVQELPINRQTEFQNYRPAISRVIFSQPGPRPWWKYVDTGGPMEVLFAIDFKGRGGVSDA